MNHISKQSLCDGVTKTPGVCGGKACIQGMRIPVWILQRMRQHGATDKEIVEQFDGINQNDLDCAWRYVALNPMEIDDEIRASKNW